MRPGPYLIPFLLQSSLQDPHAGNFLVTPDGRLAILDHGLVTEIDADRRLALIEYVAHLTAQDWEVSGVTFCPWAFCFTCMLGRTVDFSLARLEWRDLSFHEVESLEDAN